MFCHHNFDTQQQIQGFISLHLWNKYSLASPCCYILVRSPLVLLRKSTDLSVSNRSHNHYVGAKEKERKTTNQLLLIGVIMKSLLELTHLPFCCFFFFSVRSLSRWCSEENTHTQASRLCQSVRLQWVEGDCGTTRLTIIANKGRFPWAGTDWEAWTSPLCGGIGGEPRDQ